MTAAGAVPGEPGEPAASGPVGDDDPAAVVRDAEQWFVSRGLPWFVEAVDARVAALLRPSRLVPLAVVAGVAGLAAGTLSGGAAGDVATGVLVGAGAFAVVLLLYVGGPLRVAAMARWAGRRVVTELGLLVPLLTRALPLLLLFMTFLFINTEVWQVASNMRRTTVWGTVWVFVGIGVAFLVTRLPEEVRRVEALVVADGVAGACAGTPLEAAAEHVVTEAAHVPLTRTQRANLVLVLLVAQAFQVLLLAALVLVFFLAFGSLAISDKVLLAWTTQDPHPLQVLGLRLPAHPVSDQLFQVSLFLSAFAGLYFTVYAVSDATYREQFFAELDTELERAVGVRAVYRAARGRGPSPDGSAAP